MKLSELVAYYNALDRFSVESVQRQAGMRLAEIMHEVHYRSAGTPDIYQNLRDDVDAIDKDFAQFDDHLLQLKKQIRKQIETAEKFYFAESYRIYDEEMVHESVDWILNRRMPMSEETKALITARVAAHNDWHHPGMIIRPGPEDFIDSMVGLDPLYLVDREPDLLAPAMHRFNDLYLRRLRSYHVNEYASEPILGKIPQGQFGMCLAFNFFNFKPFEVMRRYLTEIHAKLKPGGALLMTFNDCDREHCVALAESAFMCYTPGSMVKELARTIGYEVAFEWNDNGNLSWIEFKKPGTLTSLRGGQTLARIMHK